MGSYDSLGAQSVQHQQVVPRPSSRLANVNLVAQHPCFDAFTEVHFELQLGEHFSRMDAPSSLAI